MTRPPSHDLDAVLAFLRHFKADHRYSPSVREIVAGCGLSSTSVASAHLEQLEAQGLISREPGRARTVVLL